MPFLRGKVSEGRDLLGEALSHPWCLFLGRKAPCKESKTSKPNKPSRGNIPLRKRPTLYAGSKSSASF